MAQTQSTLTKSDLDQLRSLTVAVVGDVMIDSWVEGVVRRISPEAPVPVVSVVNTTHMLGGAANVARNVASLNSVANLFGVIGNDTWSDVYKSLVNKNSNIFDHSVSDPQRQTTVKTRIVGNHQQIARLDQETNSGLSSDVQQQLINQLNANVSSCDCVIVSDYAKGVIDHQMVNKIQIAAQWRDTPVLVDPKSSDWTTYQGSSLITPNWHEFVEVCRVNHLDPANIAAAARELMQKFDLGALLITQADQGMTLVLPHVLHHEPALKREVADVSGAGDTVIAMMAVCMGVHMDLIKAVRLANVAAGISVSKAGTATVSMHELAAAIGS